MSKIEWTEKTWNPIVGCSIVSPGCTNCYAMRMAARIERMNPSLGHYRGLTKAVNGNPVWTGEIGIAPDRVFREPLMRKIPTMWFVNSMSDLFHDDIPEEIIARVFYVMAQSPHHTFQILTKRSKRMRDILNDPEFSEDVRATLRIIDNPDRGPFVWPLSNVWLGVSIERQKEADERIPDLLAIPAAVRFVSAEPLLGPVHFTNIKCPDCNGGHMYCRTNETLDAFDQGLDWVIVGGESGPGARPMHPDWARSIRDQCGVAGAPFFFKQWGEYVSVSEVAGDGTYRTFDDGATVRRTGKTVAGRLLDGREWNDMPSRIEVQP